MRDSVRNPDGLLITSPDDGGAEQQQDTVMCVHCGRHWVFERALKEAVSGSLGFCTKCSGITCGKDCQECVPMEQQIENLESVGHRDDYRTFRPVRVGGFHTTRSWENHKPWLDRMRAVGGSIGRD